MTRAAIYLRISFDPRREEAGVGRQEADCRKLADRLGWDVGKIFKENDTSAFKRRTVVLANGRKVKRVVRPLFAEMLEDFDAGRLDGLIIWDLDRFGRDPRDLEDMIDIVELRHVQVSAVSGSFSLDSDGAITNARILMAMANKSSRDTAKRAKAAAEDRASKGEFHGGRPPFGYTRKPGDKTLTPVDIQVAHLNEAADRLLAGDTLYSIIDSWNMRGMTTRPYTSQNGREHLGGMWRAKALRTALTTRSIRGETSAGKFGWEPIMDADKFERLAVLLNNPSRNFNPSGNYGGLRSMGGGLTICGGTYRQPRKGKKGPERVLGDLDGRRCGKPLYSAKYKGMIRLVCHSQRSGGCGTVVILHDPLEEYVFGRVSKR